MALTHTEGADSRQNLGFSGIIQINSLQPSVSDYPTGGYFINPNAFGFGEIHGLWLIGVKQSATGTGSSVQSGTNYVSGSNYLWQWNKSTSKLQAFGSGASSGGPFNEVAANTDLSFNTYSFIGYGF